MATAKLNTIEKIAFVVSRNTMSLMSVMEIFDNSSSGYVPRYFIHEKESIQWLQTPVKILETPIAEPPLIYVDNKGDRIKLSVEIDSAEFDEYIYLFNKLWKARMLSVDVAQRFMVLTRREKEILRLLIRAKSNETISDMLSISVSTVKTHRKNIYRKLNCSRIEDLMQFSLFIQ